MNDSLAVIFSGLGILTVVTGLATFLKHIPNNQRLPVIGLCVTGTALIVLLVLHFSAVERSERAEFTLCHSTREDRIAIRATLQGLDAISERIRFPLGNSIRLAQGLVENPVSCGDH